MSPLAAALAPPTGAPRWRVAALVVALLLVLGLCGSADADPGVRDRVLPLDSSTVAVDGRGRVVPVADPAALLPGSRVLAGRGSRRQRAAEQRWLAAGTVPAVPGLGDSTLVRDALLDLRTLTRSDGVPVAGWAPAWRYVWPRDSALVAVALARTGHAAEARAVLTFLQRVQPPSGVFAARYRPDGRVPDDRPAQLDGVGWALWALDAVVAAAPPGQRPVLLARYRPLLDRSAAAALAALTRPDGLPPASPDYWERPERRPTLATAALLRAGLAAAGRLYRLAGDAGRGTAVDAAAERLTAAVRRAFGPEGYPRSLGGPASSVDLGVAFWLPPFAPGVDPAAVAAFRAAPRHLLRPAGGLAPGGSWRDDGISWTPTTASYALTAAALGERGTALAWLRWLDAHRTAAGSLPEKVLADGRPASVAPLAWTAAAVVLTAATLSG